MQATTEQLRLMILAPNRREEQIRKAASAANKSTWPAPPKGISKPRWRAMIASLHFRGLPT